MTSKPRTKRIAAGGEFSLTVSGRMYLGRIGRAVLPDSGFGDAFGGHRLRWPFEMPIGSHGAGEYVAPTADVASVFGVAPELNEHVERVKDALVELRRSVPTLHMATVMPDGQISIDIRDDEARSGVQVTVLAGGVMLVSGVAGSGEFDVGQVRGLPPGWGSGGTGAQVGVQDDASTSSGEDVALVDDRQGLIDSLRSGGLSLVAGRLEYLGELEAEDPEQPRCNVESLKSFVDFVLSSPHLSTEDVSVNREGLVSAHWFLSAPVSDDADGVSGVIVPNVDERYWGDGDGGLTMVFTDDGQVRYAATSGPIVDGRERLRDTDVVPATEVLSAVAPFLRYAIRT